MRRHNSGAGHPSWPPLTEDLTRLWVLARLADQLQGKDWSAGPDRHGAGELDLAARPADQPTRNWRGLLRTRGGSHGEPLSMKKG
jgi:hypothetical protein